MRQRLENLGEDSDFFCMGLETALIEMCGVLGFGFAFWGLGLGSGDKTKLGLRGLAQQNTCTFPKILMIPIFCFWRGSICEHFPTRRYFTSINALGLLISRGHCAKQPKGGRNSHKRYTLTCFADHFSQFLITKSTETFSKNLTTCILYNLRLIHCVRLV